MPNSVKLCWDTEKTPTQINSLMDTLASEYPIVSENATDAITIEFVSGGPEGQVAVRRDGLKATIISQQPHLTARGIGALLSGVVEDGKEYVEHSEFERFGIMLDCSRNAVMTDDSVKRWMRELALLGYNVVMLYTEDTYELPGEEFFGYQRGRYSADELKEIDAYGANLNIEVVGCIQTLGHLEHVLKWPAYSKIKDTAQVMLVDEDATYALIDKMLEQFASCCTSKRIHIGMDETHDLGRGAFMDRHGYERGFDLFNRHLARVVDLCKARGLEPVIWSDMYFRLGNPTQDYYDPNTIIPEDVKAAIPKDVQLVYWDYYHDNEEFYLDWIDRHRKLGKEPLVASGIWTWTRWWYDHKDTSKFALPCIKACRKASIKELFFTMWGDNGAYCEFNSAMAGLALCAEHAFVGDGCDETVLARRFGAICKSDYNAVVAASDVNRLCYEGHLKIDTLMWDDPISLTAWKIIHKGHPQFWESKTGDFDAIVNKLSSGRNVTSPIDMDHAYRLAKCFQKRYALNLSLIKAYEANDKPALAQCRDEIPNVVATIDDLIMSLRRQWLSRNKPQGLGVLQQRFGGIKQRYAELEMQLNDYVQGNNSALDEFADGL